MIKITKMSFWQFWSRDGIQIFSLDLVLDWLIGRDLILFFLRNSSKTVMAMLTASLVMLILYTSPALSVCQYSLLGLATACLMGLRLVLVVCILVVEKTARP